MRSIRNGQLGHAVWGFGLPNARVAAADTLSLPCPTSPSTSRTTRLQDTPSCTCHIGKLHTLGEAVWTCRGNSSVQRWSSSTQPGPGGLRGTLLSAVQGGPTSRQLGFATVSAVPSATIAKTHGIPVALERRKKMQTPTRNGGAITSPCNVQVPGQTRDVGQLSHSTAIGQSKPTGSHIRLW